MSTLSVSMTNSPPRWRPYLRLANWLAAFAAAASLTACGGGDVAGVGTGGTGSFAVGSINGFGSVVVNGVRYDTSGAVVLDEHGNPRSVGDLQLGMVVQVRGTLAANRASGSASQIVYQSELTGPIDAVNLQAGTLTVFGRTIHVKPTTIFKDASGLSDLRVGHVVEVYGLPGPNNAITATRIEFEALSVAAFAADPRNYFELTGTVSGLVGTPPNLRFGVVPGTVQIETHIDTRINGTIQNGALVSVYFDPIAVGGFFRARKVELERPEFDVGIGLAEIEGLVTDFNPATGEFRLNGFPVVLGPAVVFEDGVRADLVNGARVEVYGNVVGGVLVAVKVEFEDDQRVPDPRKEGRDAPFEFYGIAECMGGACPAGSGQFSLRGVQIRYDAQTIFDDVTTATLHGARVEVYAVVHSSTPEGTVFRATRIELDD